MKGIHERLGAGDGRGEGKEPGLGFPSRPLDVSKNSYNSSHYLLILLHTLMLFYPMTTLASPSKNSYSGIYHTLHQYTEERECGGTDLEVEGSGSLACSSRDVVVRSVAGAVPSSVVTCLSDRYASQVGADSQHHEPVPILSSAQNPTRREGE
jgi:hypothetical protein